MKAITIHVTPGVNSRRATRDFLKNGAVGIDDIGENLYEGVLEEILYELGHAGDDIDIRTERIETAIGPVFVFRDADLWSAAEAREAVLADPCR